MENKIVHVNKLSYDYIINQLKYIPENLVINDYIENNKAVIVDENFLNYEAKIIY